MKRALSTGMNENLDEIVDVLKEEARHGSLTTPPAEWAITQANAKFDGRHTSILPTSAQENIILPVFAKYLSKHGDKYAEETAYLSEQYSSKAYWQQMASNESRIPYLSDDNVSSMRRGLDFLFHAGVLRDRTKRREYPGLSYFQCLGPEALAKTADTYNEDKGIFTNLANNFRQVSNRLAEAGRFMFSKQ